MPEDTEHEVRGFVKEGLCVDADDLDHGLGDGERLVEVLPDLVDVQVATLVDCTHIDGVLLDVVNEVNQCHTVRARMEEIITTGIDGKALTHKLVIFACAIDSARNYTNLFVEIVVVTTSFGLHLLASACLGHHDLAEALA